MACRHANLRICPTNPKNQLVEIAPFDSRCCILDWKDPLPPREFILEKESLNQTCNRYPVENPSTGAFSYHLLKSWKCSKETKVLQLFVFIHV